jgi:branched-subunit amino acid aminotransferase/4-amino-4-deoxychorismate lyase
VFGKTFTDYMMYAEWDSEGWSRPVIKPYGPLSLNPSASVFHYATEVNTFISVLNGFFDSHIIKILVL